MAKLFWVRKNGKVLAYDIEEENDTEWGLSYHIEVVYQYTVDGEKYQNDRIQFTDGSGYELAYLKRYGLYDLAKEDDIELWYNPKSPSESVVLNKISPGSLLTTVVCLSLALGTLLYAYPRWDNL